MGKNKTTVFEKIYHDENDCPGFEKVKYIKNGKYYTTGNRRHESVELFTGVLGKNREFAMTVAIKDIRGKGKNENTISIKEFFDYLGHCDFSQINRIGIASNSISISTFMDFL